MGKPDRRTILLFHPRSMHEKNYRYFYVPYSLLSVASLVRRKEYQIIIFDNNLHQTTDFSQTIMNVAEDLLCVGISSMVGHQIRDGLSFARAVRNCDPTVPIIWGGALPTMMPHNTLQHECVDIIVRGQGQQTLCHLADCLSSRRDLREVAGISYKVNGQPIHNPSRSFQQLRDFPSFSPVYDLVDLGLYIKSDQHISSRTLNYISAQGCPFKCGFCSEVALWHGNWTGAPAARILQDIAFLVDRYGVNGIKFQDPEFFVRR